jgi:hypothetical protein
MGVSEDQTLRYSYGMRAAARLAEVEAVDRFLAAEKHLYGAPPEFGPTNFQRKRQAEWGAVWPIADEFGVVTSGQLRIVTRPGLEPRVTINVIFRNQNVGRLDFVPATECEDNPFWAVGDIPRRVCGPHFHGWETNREHVLRGEIWEMPCREPLPPQVRRFEQALPWLADHINLVLTPEQRMFDVPTSFA